MVMGHLVGLLLAVMDRREFDREGVRRPKRSRAGAWRRPQRASCLLGISDQFCLTLLYDVRLNGLRKRLASTTARSLSLKYFGLSYSHLASAG